MIRSLQHVALAVPDPEAGRAFYETMGLEGREEGGHLVFRCPGRAQDQIRLVPAEKKSIAWIAWSTRSEELVPLSRRLRDAGVETETPPDGTGLDGLWFRDPNGVLVNVSDTEDAPQTRPGVEINNPGQPYARLARRGAPDRSIDSVPRRLGHVLKFTTDIEADTRFYTEVLGMQISDRIGDDLAVFLRGAGDSDHHLLAMASSEAPGLHHISWEMANLDAVRLCAERMLAAGYHDGWGLGRHIYGSNYFHYVRDPWMSLNEFFWDIDFIPGDADWQAVVAEPNEDALAQWATTPAPDDFLKNFEGASA